MRSYYEECVDIDELRRFVAFQMSIQAGWTGDAALKAAPKIEAYLKDGQSE